MSFGGGVGRSRMDRITKTVYRNTLLLLLGATRALGKIEFSPPTKWLSVVESVRASSDILYFKLSSLDEDVEKEFVQKEEIIEKRLGKEKFYSDTELNDLKRKKGEITL